VTAFDLDAASEDVRGAPWPLVFRGVEFTMAGELSMSALFALGEFADLLAKGEAAEDEAGGLVALRAFVPLREAVSALFVSPEEFNRFLALGPGQSNLMALLAEAVRHGTGATLGEVSAPSESSDGVVGRPRPISLGSTG
jgi:hypothetical protein